MFKEMNYVYAVYQEKSFTKAAQKMYLSQPALSAMVKKAEQKVGLPIFNRSTNPVSLTEAGRYYISQAERIMQIHRDAETYFLMTAQRDICHLRLGGPGLYQAYVFPAYINGFLAENPQANVSWVEARNEVLMQKLLTSEIELFPEVDYLFSDQVDGRIWNEEHLMLVVPMDLPVNRDLEHCRMSWEQICNGEHLTGQIPSVDLAGFAEQPFILMTDVNDSYHRCMDICRRAGFTPKKVSMAAAQMLTAYQLSELGYGCSFVSDTLVRCTAPTKKLCFYSLSDPSACRPMYIYFRRNAKLSPVGEKFLRYMLRQNPFADKG